MKSKRPKRAARKCLPYQIEQRRKKRALNKTDPWEIYTDTDIDDLELSSQQYQKQEKQEKEKEKEKELQLELEQQQQSSSQQSSQEPSPQLSQQSSANKENTAVNYKEQNFIDLTTQQEEKPVLNIWGEPPIPQVQLKDNSLSQIHQFCLKPHSIPPLELNTTYYIKFQSQFTTNATLSLKMIRLLPKVAVSTVNRHANSPNHINHRQQGTKYFQMRESSASQCLEVGFPESHQPWQAADNFDFPLDANSVNVLKIRLRSAVTSGSRSPEKTLYAIQINLNQNQPTTISAAFPVIHKRPKSTKRSAHNQRLRPGQNINRSESMTMMTPDQMIVKKEWNFLARVEILNQST